MLYTVSLPDSLELILVTPSGKTVRRSVPVSQEELRRVAQEFIGEVTNVDSQEYLPLGQQLYRWLIAPIESELKDKDIGIILFSLDSGLRTMPIAALHNGKEFLVEKYSLGLIPTINLTDTRYKGLRNAQVLAMGASVFQPETGLKSLAAVPTELSLITPQLWPGRSFLNEQFTLDNLKAQRTIKPYEVVHLATHAEFSANNFYIQLWNSKLRPEQLRKLGWKNPAVELLVLSACRTARGDEAAELGFAGLAVQAGVKSALASLWSVDDTGTLLLMYQFYDRLKTEPIKAEALRYAQIAMLRNQVKITDDNVAVTPQGNLPLPSNVSSMSADLSHPYYWAAFTMIGSPW